MSSLRPGPSLTWTISKFHEKNTLKNSHFNLLYASLFCTSSDQNVTFGRRPDRQTDRQTHETTTIPVGVDGGYRLKMDPMHDIIRKQRKSVQDLETSCCCRLVAIMVMSWGAIWEPRQRRMDIYRHFIDGRLPCSETLEKGRRGAEMT